MANLSGRHAAARPPVYNKRWGTLTTIVTELNHERILSANISPWNTSCLHWGCTAIGCAQGLFFSTLHPVPAIPHNQFVNIWYRQTDIATLQDLSWFPSLLSLFQVQTLLSQAWETDPAIRVRVYPIIMSSSKGEIGKILWNGCRKACLLVTHVLQVGKMSNCSVFDPQRL